MNSDKLKYEILTKNDDDLIEFIKSEFEQRGNIAVDKYENNLARLKELDTDTLNTGITRMNFIKEHFETTKSLSFIITIVIAIFSYYGKWLGKFLGNEGNSDFLVSLILLIIFVVICSTIVKSRSRMLTCVYFKNLLEISQDSKND